MPCNSSPAPGSISTRKKSVMSATTVSDCPMPTVSTSTTSKPAASQTSMVSRVRAATPPSVPEDGEGRMKALRSTERRAMRVLSPRIEPPVREEEGSTASTATLWPASVRLEPSMSMVVDLPTPGTPVTPTRIAPPVAGSRRCKSAPACARWSGRRLSIRVMARASAARSPDSTRSASSSGGSVAAREIAGEPAGDVMGRYIADRLAGAKWPISAPAWRS